MKKRIALLSLALMAIAAIVVPLSNAETKHLSAKGRDVVDYLLDDWQKPMHSTSIALAMENLGMKPDDDIRLEVGNYFRENNRLARNLINWKPNNYLLSNEEKRIAKQIINTFEHEDRIPDLQELSHELDLPAKRLQGRLAFMSRAGLLVPSSETDLGYALTKKYFLWGGPLHYNFHTLTIGDEKPFDVW